MFWLLVYGSSNVGKDITRRSSSDELMSMSRDCLFLITFSCRFGFVLVFFVCCETSPSSFSQFSACVHLPSGVLFLNEP